MNMIPMNLNGRKVSGREMRRALNVEVERAACAIQNEALTRQRVEGLEQLSASLIAACQQQAKAIDALRTIVDAPSLWARLRWLMRGKETAPDGDADVS